VRLSAIFLFLATVLLAACRGPIAPGIGARSALSAPPSASARDAPTPDAWVESTLASLSLRQKAAQLVFVRAYGHFQSPESAEHRGLLTELRDLGVGGIVLFASELETIPRLLNELQEAAPLPLLVASDLERGLAFRVHRGTVPLPYAMAVGATRSEEAAYASGEITAREARAVGIHWALAPVVDVNNNPANPIVNLRSYGEDPRLVGRLAAAFIRGVREGGLLTSAKHFPGHGDTGVDSHLALPVLGVDRARLDAVELVPFRHAIAAGVDSIMVAHLAVPALDPSGAPATLSPTLTGQLLRSELGFDGLIVTDALEMAGVRPAWVGEAAARAFAAGADVLLLPADPAVAVDSLVRAVAEGRISEARLDASVRRVLTAKARLGLNRQRRVDPTAFLREVARPEDLLRAREIARASITVVRNEGEVLPLAAEKPLRLLHLVMSSDFQDSNIRGIPEAQLAARAIETETVRLGTEISEATARRILAEAPAYTHVLVSAFVRVTSSKGSVDMVPAQADLLRGLAGRGVPVIVVSYGSPYLLAQFPEVPVYVCAYGAAESSQRAAIAALFGEIATTGKLPITLPGLYPPGHGLELPRRPMSLVSKRPEEVGLAPDAFAEADDVLAGFLAEKAFPGGVLAVGYRGDLVHLHPFGRLSYEADAPRVEADTLYDLASLTKVVATTTMAMILVDRGRLDLDKAVVDFLPDFRGTSPEGFRKERVTVRHLLTHSSGVDWWAPLYRDTVGKAEYLARIQAMDLVYEPGTATKYSDLGIILLGEILERVAGEPLAEFVRGRVFEPLGMHDTGFRPDPSLLSSIAPTEIDSTWRHRLLRGEVHDENAFALGGVAPHAGLFSTAPDLARFAQMLANGGVLGHRRIVSRETVELFTRRAELPPGSTRALGWDTRSVEGSSSGHFFSFLSFGHTGFTGTSLWIDPERQLFVLLLTNRVHPSRENTLIREVRPAVADAVVRGLGEGRVATGLDRLAAGDSGIGIEHLVGKRLGLVVHRASVTADGRPAIEVFRERGLTPVRLFTPEHGLTGTAGAGEKVESGRDPASGLPIVSLYGDHRKPTAEDLAGLDALVFDLQGAGVRFYTYVSTLLLCLEAAAGNGLELVVLDRPNPLGGERVEGPVSAPREVVPASFVNLAPGPLVHGLTLGEMALYANRRLPRPARLTVIPMRGWRRSMVWADTGLPWVPPSPNLRSAEAALAYPGVGLLEATNLSEGRGTEAPFLRLGAPWLTVGSGAGPGDGLDLAGLAAAAPGFAFTQTRFTPLSSPAAPAPRYRGETCRGLAITVVEPSRAEPYRLGIELLAALGRQPGFAWRSLPGENAGAALTRLLGTPRIFAELEAGKTVDEILAADHDDHTRWRRERRAILLY